jgi:hypothetical protein
MKFEFDDLRYDPETGDIWRKVGHLNQTFGYRQLKVGGRPYQEHRVAWFLHYGVWPEGMVDHINGDKSDNRIENLRLADARSNARNSRKRKNNKSGKKGVLAAENGRWHAQIRADGQPLYLGTFDTKEEAHRAYCDAAKKHFGEFANPG